MKSNKKGMINVLTASVFGIITLVIIVGIGLTVMSNLTTSVGCASTFTYNVTDSLCVNASGTSGFATNTAGTGLKYGMTQIGSTGLLSWLPAVIALLIGVLFLSYFSGRNKGTSY